MEQLSQFCTFRLAGLLFGIELRCVQEVVRSAEMSPVPLAPAVVKGLINLRGQIVTALDLRTRLQLDATGVASPAMNVVVRTDDGPVSLLVDEIGDVVEVGEESFERPPETLHALVRSMITGVYKLDDVLMHVLDAARICQFGEETDLECAMVRS
jgi:purine-binding chemotaxis protein CheW